jgi:hypothetical protein
MSLTMPGGRFEYVQANQSVSLGAKGTADSFKTDRVCNRIGPGFDGGKSIRLKLVWSNQRSGASRFSRVLNVETVEERNRGVRGACDGMWLRPHWRPGRWLKGNLQGMGELSVPCTKMHQ